MKKYLEKNWDKILLGFILLVNALGMSNDIFNGDSALYASISKNIAFSYDFIHLNSIMQKNWIDKPHFSFWIWGIFIKFFGNNEIGFKLPVYLSFLILLRYTFLFTEHFYGKKNAWISILILGSSLHMIISTNDVRMDIFLITFMMAAIYHFNQYLVEHNLRQFMLACLFTSIAIMTKGIFILIPIGISILSYLYTQRNLRLLLNPIWILGLILIAIGIYPAIFALKIQFETYSHSHILGQVPSNYLKFFFWDSQFGRFNSNLGQLASNGDKFFYFHTLLWVIAPWTFLLFKSFFLRLNPLKEYISLSCFSILFIILSFSKTQLSHHALVLLPFMCIILSTILTSTNLKQLHHIIDKVHLVLLAVFILAPIYLCLVLTGKIQLLLLVLIFSMILLLYFIYLSDIPNKIIPVTTLVGIYLGLFLNLIAYPEILNYQSGKNASHYLKNNNISKPIEEFYTNISLLNFYSKNSIKNSKVLDLERLIHRRHQLLFANSYGKNYLDEHKIPYKILNQFYDYRVTVLTRNFLDFSTRKNTCEIHYLLEINTD